MSHLGLNSALEFLGISIIYVMFLLKLLRSYCFCNKRKQRQLPLLV